MNFNLTIPQSRSDSLNLTVALGQTLYVLGANGSGKSSLMHLFYSAHSANAHRISAHRQTWFESNTNILSSHDKRSLDSQIRNADQNVRARFTEDNSSRRASISIYDLINAENERARSIANAVDRKDIEYAKKLSKVDAPVKVINELLRLSNIPIEISIHGGEQVFAKKQGGAQYSIAELSDGERNALLIAASILTVKEGSLVLVDEPERHLHRAIISPLLTLLFERRPDCAFIVSTHEVMLPADNPRASTLLVRDCVYAETNVTSWDVDLVPAGEIIDDELRTNIL